MPQITKVIGPPGTGKTTFLVRQIARARGKLRRGRTILVSSLTRAAATEFRSRLPDDVYRDVIVGTLHSHALNVLGRPTLIGPKDIERWNVDHHQYTLPKSLFAKDGAEQQEKSDLWAQYHMARAMMTPLEGDRLQSFHELFSRWKVSEQVVDFTDLIEQAIAYSPTGPGVPQFIFIDEAQDHDRLQWKLINKWAADEDCEHLILVGDPAQNLYEWRGSEPTAMEDAAPDAKRIVLAKSYRVPSGIIDVAHAIHARMTDVVNDDFSPRDGDDGGVTRLGFSMSRCTNSDQIVDIIEDECREGYTVMALATCGFMLEPILKRLRHRGVPFHNPYKRDNAKFNPLGPPAHGIGWLERLRMLWAGAEVARWTTREVVEWLKLFDRSTILERGAYKELEAEAKSTPHAVMTASRLSRVTNTPTRLNGLLDDPYRWAANNVARKYRTNVGYATRVHKKWGERYLGEQTAIVGTIHSVKGGEAEVVLLNLELSAAEIAGQENGSANQIHRKFYVGSTRAKSQLILLGGDGHGYYTI